MRCERCGGKVPANSIRCPECGKSIAMLATKSRSVKAPIFTFSNLARLVFWSVLLVASLYSWLSFREFLFKAEGNVVRKEIKNVPRYNTRGVQHDEFHTYFHVENERRVPVNAPQYYDMADVGDAFEKRRFSFAVKVNGRAVPKPPAEAMRLYAPPAGLIAWGAMGLAFRKKSARR